MKYCTKCGKELFDEAVIRTSAVFYSDPSALYEYGETFMSL